jgi:hypothetical protein
MSSLTAKLVACVIGFAIVVAAVPADAAKATKHKKVAAAYTGDRAQSRYRGANLFPAGPVYNGPDYLGDDPDPFIRSPDLSRIERPLWRRELAAALLPRRI